MIPSAREMMFRAASGSKNLSANIRKRAAVIKIEKGKSFFIRDFPISIGLIAAAQPATSIRFTIFEPTTFPMAIPSTPWIAEVTLTASSGRLVPNETIVRPMTIEGMWNAFAIAEAPSTKKSAPFTRNANPAARIKI